MTVETMWEMILKEKKTLKYPPNIVFNTNTEGLSAKHSDFINQSGYGQIIVKGFVPRILQFNEYLLTQVSQITFPTNLLSLQCTVNILTHIHSLKASTCNRHSTLLL